MPTALDSDLHKIRTMIIGATAEFSVAFNALTAAAAGMPAFPYRDFGHVKVFDLDAAPETTPRITAVRGVRRQKGTEPTLTKLIYKLTCNEADALKLGFLYSGSETGDFTQGAHAAANGDALDFTIAPSIAGYWYDLRVAGVNVRGLTGVTIATKTEGTDFVLDLVLGRIRFLTTQSTSLTPVITSAEITAASETTMRKITPMAAAVRSGFGRLIVFDKYAANNVAFEHRDFSCDISIESGPGSQDGTGEAAIVIMVTVTFEEGLLLVRN